MKRTFLRLLVATLMGFALLESVANAQTQPCPSPPPFDPYAVVPVSPIIPNDSAGTFAWVGGEEWHLESSNAQRVGNAITVNAFILDLGQGMAQAPNCFSISVGTLPAGTYLLTLNTYKRLFNTSYPPTPTASATRELVVMPTSAQTVPAISSGMLLTLFVGICLSALSLIRNGRA